MLGGCLEIAKGVALCHSAKLGRRAARLKLGSSDNSSVSALIRTGLSLHQEKGCVYSKSKLILKI
jgi:hypothetical protein